MQIAKHITKGLSKKFSSFTWSDSFVKLGFRNLSNIYDGAFFETVNGKSH